MMTCECGTKTGNEDGAIIKVCAYHVQARLVLPPERLARLSPTPSWHEKATRFTIEMKSRAAKTEVIGALREWDLERRAARGRS